MNAKKAFVDRFGLPDSSADLHSAEFLKKTQKYWKHQQKRRENWIVTLVVAFMIALIIAIKTHYLLSFLIVACVLFLLCVFATGLESDKDIPYDQKKK